MYSLIALILIIVLAALIMKRNYKSRGVEIQKNVGSFNDEIKKFYYSLPAESQHEFASNLNGEWKDLFSSILEDRFNFGRNVWALQSQIAQQQELFQALSDFRKKKSQE